MNFKKYLRSKTGWSFIEYAIILAAVTAATVIVIQQMLSQKGRIHQALRYQTDVYITKITGGPMPPAPIPPPEGCPQLEEYTVVLNELNAQLDALRREKDNIDEQIREITDKIGDIEPKERRAHRVCEACGDVCEHIFGMDACDAEDALEDAIDKLKDARDDLRSEKNRLANKIQELKQQIDETEAKINEILAKECPGVQI